MDYKPTLNLTAFAERVRGMNQLKAQDLRLTANEANNLHVDITTMLAEIARLSIELKQGNAVVPQIDMDGGKF